MRSTREIDTRHGRMLFSPVLAHTLEPGDLIDVDDNGRTTRVLAIAYGHPYVMITDTDDAYQLRTNCPVLRAVGARSAGVIP